MTWLINRVPHHFPPHYSVYDVEHPYRLAFSLRFGNRTIRPLLFSCILGDSVKGVKKKKEGGCYCGNKPITNVTNVNSEKEFVSGS